MRILDNDLDKKLDNISILLTKEEVTQLRGYLNQLIENPKLQHFHLSSPDYQKEITVCIYDKDNLENLNQRSIILIKEDR